MTTLWQKFKSAVNYSKFKTHASHSRSSSSYNLCIFRCQLSFWKIACVRAGAWWEISRATSTITKLEWSNFTAASRRSLARSFARQQWDCFVRFIESFWLFNSHKLMLIKTCKIFMSRAKRRWSESDEKKICADYLDWLPSQREALIECDFNKKEGFQLWFYAAISSKMIETSAKCLVSLINFFLNGRVIFYRHGRIINWIIVNQTTIN